MAYVQTNRYDIAMNTDDLFGSGTSNGAVLTSTKWTYWNSENTVEVTFSTSGATGSSYSGAITKIEVTEGSSQGMVLSFLPYYSVSWSTSYNYYYRSLSWAFNGNPAAIYLAGDDTISGSGEDDILKGYGGADSISGSLGDDALFGGSGADSLFGGAGNDSLSGDSGDDQLNGGAGDDRANGGTGDDTIRGGDGDDFLSGGLGDDTINGDAGDDSVSGGDDDDTLSGGDGNDMLDGEIGSDRLSGGAGDDDLVGGDGSDDLAGGDGNDTLLGDAGNDRLDGGAGRDKMSGGSGNDTYYVDNAKDVVTEASNAGLDLVRASVSYILSANIERLTLVGTGDLNGTGNTLANTILGTSGKNTIDGGGGADSLTGGGGDDTYIVDNSDDFVTESAGGGSDTVKASASFTLSANVEKLTLTGTGNINGTGNAIANSIVGNNGQNKLSGANGNDTLDGGLGKDALTGGSGADSFIFKTALGASNIDSVKDFVAADDTIKLENAIFTALTATGTLASAAFYGSDAGKAHDSSDRIIYETDTGKLFYDKDGTGSAVAVQFAVLDTKPGLTNADFVII